MKHSRRKSGNAVDGFVPRNRAGQARKRVTLDDQTASSTQDGFVPRSANASQPLELRDDNWVDDSTLDIGGLEDKPSRQKEQVKKPHWWQFSAKRRIKKGKPPLSKRQRIARRIFLTILLVLMLIGAYLGWKAFSATSKVFDGNILGILNTTKLDGEDQGRVNILLAGNSADDAGHDGANLTDSIMIVSLNTKDNSAFMMSIPRDLYVKYGVTDCSVGYQGKINAAYICGEQTDFSEPGYPKGGMGLLSKVVHDNFGIDVNYYALVNYGAFRDSVDAVGGITVNIKSSDPRGIYDPSLDYTSRKCCSLAKYPNGPVKLDGKQALNLARARGDSAGSYGFAGGDFTRTEHQRQMLVALKDKALSAGTLSNPAKIGSLFDSIGGNVKTNFKVSELRRLYDIGKKVQSNNIKSIGLTDDGVELVTTDMISGAGSVVVPTAGRSNFSQIKAYILKLTSSDPLVREGAKVTVLNGSGVVGLAQKRADELTERGLNVSGVGNAASRTTTVVVDLSGGKNNNTKRYLEKQFGVVATTDATTNSEAKKYSSDFVVILGTQSAGSTTTN